MNSSTVDSSIIGKEVAVSVNEKVDSYHNLIKYKCQNLSQLPDKWDTYLTALEEDYDSGEETTGWVYDFDTKNKTLTVTTYERGRADLHNLEEDHRKAANHVVQLANHHHPTSNDVDVGLISHAKSLFKRCIMKDEWDWYTVFALLQKPSNTTLERGRGTLDELRTVAENNNDEAVREKIDKLEKWGISGRLAELVRAIDHGEEFEAVDDKYIINRLQELQWYEFENFLADMWSERGWEVELNDDDVAGGDVIARKPQLDLRIDIEAKRRIPDNKIAVGEATQYASMARRKRTDRAILVTTGKFTSGARREEERNNFILIDGEDLLDIIRSEGLYHILKKYT